MGLIIFGLIIILIAIFGSKGESQIGKFKSLLMLAGVVVVIIGFFTSAIRQIDPGDVGVQVLFGDVKPTVLHEGLNVVNPLIKVEEMSVKTQNYTMSGTYNEGQQSGDDAIRVLSKDGLEVTLDMTLLYRIIPSDAPQIFKTIGIDYQVKIIRPIARSRIRENAVNYNATDLYSNQREAFELSIKKSIENDFKSRGIFLEQLLIRNINLPESVKKSIERKITAVQDAERMKYVLQKATQEAEVKRVAARGTSDAQKIINSGLSDKVLRYEAINVQKQLVNSPNSKIIVLGSGKGSPPFIIGK